jgi:hypothetical protein
MFPVDSIDAGVGNVGILTSSYTDDSLAFFSKMIIPTARETVEAPTTSKTTVKTQAVMATPLLLLEPG